MPPSLGRKRPAERQSRFAVHNMNIDSSQRKGHRKHGLGHQVIDVLDTSLAGSLDCRTKRAACDIANHRANRAADGISQSGPVEPPSTDAASL